MGRNEQMRLARVQADAILPSCYASMNTVLATNCRRCYQNRTQYQTTQWHDLQHRY
jgi:ribosomal protein L40E